MTNTPQVVVLAAGAPPAGESVATGSRVVDRHQTVLEWQLHALRTISQDIQVVVGYDLQMGMYESGGVKLRVNRSWSSTGSVASLLVCDLDPDRPLLVCYGDLLFHSAALNALAQSEADVRVAVDGALRAPARPSREAVVQRGLEPIFGTLADLEGAQAYLCGLFWFSPGAVAQIRQLGRAAGHLAGSHMAGLLGWLRRQGQLSFELVQTGEHVVDLDEERAVSRFVFGTKAQTLARLEDRLTSGLVMPQVCFAAHDWPLQAPSLVEDVIRRFAGRSLIVRSSAASEDQFSGSMAGRFTSVLNVAAEVPAVRAAVDRVVGSFAGEPAASVLVQPMVTQVAFSGVVLTRTLGRGAPYYVLNFTDSHETDLVTGGRGLPRRAYLFRGAPVELLEAKLQPVMRMVQEIERLTDLDALDIEFAVAAESTPYLLQVRPLATSTDHGLETDRLVGEALERAQLEFQHLAMRPGRALGRTAVFGVMPDWNPAEIIGEVPTPLAFDLYRELVTDWAWAQQRHEFGYRDLRGQPLLRNFCGRPYVDVRASFTSFVPADIPEPLAETLVESALQRLTQNPALHDKVEFEVMPTCLDFDFGRWDERLFRAACIGDGDRQKVEQAYRTVTTRAWFQVEQSMAAVHQFEERWSAMPEPDWARVSVMAVLHDCRDQAVLHFAHLARCAFIAVSLLRTAVAKGLIAQARADEFLASVETVSHQFRNDVHAVSADMLSRSDLVRRYGHLRPGTYDASVPSYAEAPDAMLWPLIDNPLPPEHPAFDWTDDERRSLSTALKLLQLPHDADRFGDFLRAAIRGREYGKFVFSRVLSSWLSWVRRESSSLGVDPSEIACLGVGEVLSTLHGASALSAKELLAHRVALAKRARSISLLLEWPQVIFDPSQFLGHSTEAGHPNFVARGVVMAESICLNGYTTQDLEGRLVLVESADPGYDWLFGHRFGGLITAYGGANSHMAIRCAELGLPAAIGVGPLMFRLLAKASVLRLDCDSRRIEVVR